ncbi:DUF3500 domain-containing protein [Ferruginibacter sp.]
MKQRILIPLSAAVLTIGVFLACKKDTSDTGTASAAISSLNCASATFSAAATINVAYNATASVPYTGGNGVAYSAGTAITSTGVTGLTATLTSGTLTNSTGNLVYTITGTPASSGTAAFAISFGGQSCSLSLIVNAAGSTSATVTALNCSSAVLSSTATINTAYTGTASVPYTGGNGVSYTAGTAITSTGVTGLTATLVAGTLASGAGNITYNISGTPTTAGTAAFAITFGGQTCSFSLTVSSTTASCSSLSGVAKVVCLANTFLATLSTSQQSTVVLTLNLTNAKRWSNLPCALSCRNGLLFSSLSSTQQAAALALIQAASGTGTGEGYDEFNMIRSADDYLGQTASGYSSGNYVIAFLGTPSTTGKWMLQFGGHHYAQNITYDAGVVTSITPLHEAVEPKGSFTYNGTTYAGPMATEQSVMADMLASFSSTELASAKLSTTFSDCLMIPGSTTNTFPTTKQGIKVSTLSTAAQAKVLAAMAPWVNDLDAASAASFMTIYQNELANTYVSYSGNSSGTPGSASTFLNANTDYVRIDGPSVWIEFICQNGVVLSGIHYHTVMRDHNRDYIGL